MHEALLFVLVGGAIGLPLAFLAGFDAVCQLWDDPATYEEASRRARAVADARYAEAVMRRRYYDYFESLGPGESLFDS